MEDTKKWLEERITYIAQNCDLNDADNKRALECVEKVEGE